MPITPPDRLGRILCVTSNLPRWDGDSTTPFVLNLAEDLQSLGWEIDLLAPHAPDAALEEEMKGVRVERFRYCWPEKQETICYQGGALVNLRKDKANYLKLPAFLSAEFFAVVRKLFSRRYDVIHSHWILPQGFVGMLAGKLRPTPHVVTVHGGDIFGLPGKAMAQAKVMVLRNADAVTVNSMYTGDAVNKLSPGMDHMHCIPMGVTVPELETPMPHLADSVRARYRKGNGLLLVFVGRIVDEKGVEDLLLAMPQIRQDFPDVKALIVGDGQDRVAMEELTRSLDLVDCVDFLGWVDPSEVTAYYAAADIFVAPSRRAVDGWVEAQGLAILEAMLARTPVIASRLGGITDSVLDEQTGLLIDERSPEQITNAVRRLTADPELTASIIEHAYQRTMGKFSRIKSASDFSDLFLQLKSGKRKA